MSRLLYRRAVGNWQSDVFLERFQCRAARQCLGNTHRICGMKQSWRDQLCRMLPRHRHHDVHRYRCTVLSGEILTIQWFPKQCLPKSVRMNSSTTLDWLAIYVTETASLAFLSMMQPTRPVDCNVAFLPIQSCSTFHGSASTNPTKLKQPVKDGTIVSDTVFVLFFLILFYVIRRDFLQEFDVFVCVELGHFVFRCGFRALHIAPLASVMARNMLEDLRRFPFSNSSRNSWSKHVRLVYDVVS